MSCRLRVALIWLLLFTAAACQRELPTQCPADISLDVQPQSITMSAGQRTTPTLQLWRCGHTQMIETSFTLTSADSLIARVDSVGRRIVGVSPGTTGVSVNTPTYGLVGSIGVTITP